LDGPDGHGYWLFGKDPVKLNAIRVAKPLTTRTTAATFSGWLGGGERLEVIAAVTPVGRDDHHGGSGSVDVGFDRLFSDNDQFAARLITRPRSVAALG
jgi:hypothetical protein